MMRMLGLLLIGVAILGAADEPVVDRNSMLIDTVRRGDLIRKVDGYGSVEKAEAVIEISDAKAQDVRVNQPVLIDTREGLLHGLVGPIGEVREHKRRIAIRVEAGARLLDGERVAVSIQTEELKSVLLIARTGLLKAESTATLYKVETGGEYASRVEARTGRMNDRQIEIRSGLAEGDKVIVTKVNVPDGTARIRLK